MYGHQADGIFADFPNPLLNIQNVLNSTGIINPVYVDGHHAGNIFERFSSSLPNIWNVLNSIIITDPVYAHGHHLMMMKYFNDFQNHYETFGMSKTP